MTTACLDVAPNVKPKKKRRPLPAMFRQQALHAGLEEMVRSIVQEVAEHALEKKP